MPHQLLYACYVISNIITPNFVILTVFFNSNNKISLIISSFNEGHLLILPKKHYLDLEELDSVTAYAIMDASRRENRDSRSINE